MMPSDGGPTAPSAGRDSMGGMIRFAANLGFLWADRPLPDAIVAAAAAGFDAVECHMPYDYEPSAVVDALSATGMVMLGLNTDHSGPEFGLAAVVGRETEGRDHLDQAMAYSLAIGCPTVHVMAGRTDGGPAAEGIYREALADAAEKAAACDLTLLIEPITHTAVDGYHLRTVDHAIGTLDALAAAGVPDRIRVIVDVFHVADVEHDVLNAVWRLGDYLGHVQIAAYPDRGEPDRGEVDISTLVPAIMDAGYQGAFGAEYRPRGDLEAGLSWLEPWHRARGETVEPQEGRT